MTILKVLKESNTEDSKTLRTPSNPVDVSKSGLDKMSLLFQDMLGRCTKKIVVV